MRDYAKVAPTFWTRGSGKALRGCPEAQVVALYLFTAPASNMVGLFHTSLPIIAHETGLGLEAARKGLARTLEAPPKGLGSPSEAPMVAFDEDAELVFLPEAASYQIGDRLAKGDNRIKGIERDLIAIGNHRFVWDFLDRYEEAYNLNRASIVKALGSPSEAPPKPLRSQDQDQKQDQKQEQDLRACGRVREADQGDSTEDSSGESGGGQDLGSIIPATEPAQEELLDPAVALALVRDPIGTVKAKPEPKTSNGNPALTAVRQALAKSATMSHLAGSELPARLVTQCREHGFSGRHTLADVLQSIEEASEKASDLAAGGEVLGNGRLISLVIGFVKKGPLKEPSRRPDSNPDLGTKPLFDAAYRKTVGQRQVEEATRELMAWKAKN